MTTGCIQTHPPPTPRGVTVPVSQHRTRVLRSAAAGLVVTLAVTLAGCTGGDEEPAGVASSGAPSQPVESGATLEAKPVPVDVEVDRLVGRPLGRKARKTLEKQVGRVVSGYFDAAYLGGEYPRSRFPGAFAAFSPGATRQARSDRDLLTNARIGPRTEAVVPRAKRVRLSVLHHNGRIPGLTARIRLVFVQERADGADQRVTVQGRLLMNRSKAGPWQVFGYDVTRSDVPVRKGDR